MPDPFVSTRRSGFVLSCRSKRSPLSIHLHGTFCVRPSFSVIGFSIVTTQSATYSSQITTAISSLLRHQYVPLNPIVQGTCF